MNLDYKQMGQFLDVIDKRIENKVNTIQSPQTYPAKIVSISTDGLFADCQILITNDNTILHNLKNKTGVMLNINDEVILLAPKNDLSNIYIDKSKVGTIVDGNNMADNSVKGTSIVAHDITAEQIKANSITANEIKANSITANEIKSHSITSDQIMAKTITAESGIIADATIGHAQIIDVDVAQLNSGSIDTSKIDIVSPDGRMIIKDNSQLIYDYVDNDLLKPYLRTQNGRILDIVNGELVPRKDAQGNYVYGFEVRDSDGQTVMMDGQGVHKEGITDGAVDNSKIDPNANIDGAKLNISTVINHINADGTTNIQGSKIYVDNNTLDISFSNVKKMATDNNTNLSNFIDVTYPSDISNIQSQIDGNITSWFYDGVPTMSNAPTSTWITNDDKNNHLGDLYYDNLTGYAYRFSNPSSVYGWTKITDSDVTKALSNAQNAQDTADGKRRVFVVTPTVPYDIGDLWSQGTTGDLMKCKTAKIIGQSYSLSDWEKASKYTDDTAVTNLITNMTNDNLLTISEKQLLKVQFDAITNEKVAIDGQADTYIITTEKTAYDTSYTTLYNYVNPLLASLTTDSAITGTTMRSYFADYSSNKALLQKAITDKANTNTTSNTTAITENATAIGLKANQTDLTTTNNNLNGLTTRMSSAEGSLTVQAGQIATKVSQTDINNSVNAIQVGGRNLVLKSSQRLESNSYKIGSIDLSEDVQDGTVLTITAWGNLPEGKMLDVTFSPSTYALVAFTKNSNGLYQGTVTFNKNSSYPNDARNKLELYNAPYDGNYVGYIDKIKIELGNKPTDWSPAPEDVQSQIDSATSRISTAESLITPTAIVNTVTSSSTYTNAMGAKVNTADFGSILNQNASSIQLAVGQVSGNNLLQNTSFITDTSNWTSSNCTTAISSLTWNDLANPTWNNVSSLTWAKLGNQYNKIIITSTGTKGGISQTFPTVIGNSYTVQYIAKASSVATTGIAAIYGDILTTTMTKYSRTFVAIATSSTFECYANSGITITLDAIKVEIGTVATAWSLSQLDTNMQLDYYNTAFTVQNGLISSKVDNGSVVSAINQSAESVQISSGKVNGVKSNLVEINDSHLRATFSDGSYSEMVPSGFHHVNAGGTNDYHYLTKIIPMSFSFDGTPTMSTWIQFPNDFLGNSDVYVSLGLVNSVYPIVLANVYIDTYDTVNARYLVKATLIGRDSAGNNVSSGMISMLAIGIV